VSSRPTLNEISECLDRASFGRVCFDSVSFARAKEMNARPGRGNLSKKDDL